MGLRIFFSIVFSILFAIFATLVIDSLIIDTGDKIILVFLIIWGANLIHAVMEQILYQST